MIIEADSQVEETAAPRCPSCGEAEAESRSVTSAAVYLRCGACDHSWTIKERRQTARAEDVRKRF